MNAPCSRLRATPDQGAFRKHHPDQGVGIQYGNHSMGSVVAADCSLNELPVCPPARRGSPRPVQRPIPRRTRRRTARQAIQRNILRLPFSGGHPRQRIMLQHPGAPRIPFSVPRGEVPVFLQGDNHRGRAAPAFHDQRLVRPNGLDHGVTQRSFAHGLVRVIGRHFSPHPGVILGPDATIVNRENTLLLLTAIPEYIILLHKRVIPEAGGCRP